MIRYFESCNVLSRLAANEDHLLGNSDMRMLINALGWGEHNSAYLYAAGFPNGIVKIGISQLPRKRLMQLLSESVRSGNPMDRFHVTDSMFIGRDYANMAAARKQEREALKMARGVAALAYGHEYFIDLEFSVAVGFVDASVAAFRAKYMSKVQA